MSTLEKAQITKIKADESEAPIGSPFAVQFNPSSLKIRITNQIEGGRSSGRQRRQQSGNNSRTLSLDLHFDTADEGTTSEPISVREKTKQIEQFVMTPENNPDPPPKMKFEWGDLIIVGIVESLDVNLEHFAPNGYPLRAKATLSIKEQDPNLQFTPSNRGSSGAQSPGTSPSNPGQGTNDTSSEEAKKKVSANGLGKALGSAGALLGALNGAKIGVALDGELGVEFAARMGISPKTWRGLQVDLGSGNGFKAGTQIGFNPSASLPQSVGKSGGVNAGSSVSIKTAKALSLSNADGSKKSLQNNPDDTGKAMASLGGIDASISAIKIAEVTSATQKTVTAFSTQLLDIASPTAIATNPNNTSNAFVAGFQADSVIGPAIRRTPIVESGFVSAHEQLVRPAQVAPASVDARAISFGRGVPLQALFGTSTRKSNAKIYAKRERYVLQNPDHVPLTQFANVPGWQALQSEDTQRKATDNLDKAKYQNPSQDHNQIHSCQCEDK